MSTLLNFLIALALEVGAPSAAKAVDLTETLYWGGNLIDALVCG